MKKYDWRSAVVIVTGASSGIGRATALRLAQEGAYLALAARREDALEQLAQEIREMGSEAIGIPTDVSSPEQVQTLVQAALSTWGKIDVLVSNAGQYLRAPVAEMSLASLERSMAVNFYGGVFAIQGVLPHMLKRRKGHIVVVSTADAKVPLPPDGPYVAAKSALSGMGAILRQELHGSGVEVTLVFPGRIDTPMIGTMRVPRISAKIPPDAVAMAIQVGVERRKAEVYVPALTKALVYLDLFSPRLADWFVRKAGLSGEETGS